MDVVISNASVDDIASIHAITQAAFTKYSTVLGLPKTVSALTESEETIKEELQTKNILVAKLNWRVIGCIRYHYISKEIAYISRFAVDTTIHNAGIGKRLLDAVSDRVKRDGGSIIALHTASKMASLVRMYYGKGYYIYSTDSRKGYVRGLFIKELIDDISSIDLRHLTSL